jgi:hypothetical protein
MLPFELIQMGFDPAAQHCAMWPHLLAAPLPSFEWLRRSRPSISGRCQPPAIVVAGWGPSPLSLSTWCRTRPAPSFSLPIDQKSATRAPLHHFLSPLPFSLGKRAQHLFLHPLDLLSVARAEFAPNGADVRH